MSFQPSLFLRRVLRVLVLLTLMAALVGPPLLVLSAFGSPIADGPQWRALWNSHRVSTDVVVHLGTAAFLLLWCWFAVTAVMECAAAWPDRRGGQVRRVRLTDGPTGWIRGAVRFVVISTVSVGAVSSALGAVGHAAPRDSAVHVVEAGDSYWSIADEQMDAALGRAATPHEVWVQTQRLMDVNAPALGHRDRTLLVPGESVVLTAPDAVESVAASAAPVPSAAVVPLATPTTVAATTATPSTVPPSTAPATTASPSTVPPSTAPATTAPAVAAPITVGSPGSAPSAPQPSSDALAAGTALLGQGERGSQVPEFVMVASGLLAAGALTQVALRRRRVLRGGTAGIRLEAPSFSAARLELRLRALDPAERVARLDVALRASAADLAAQQSSVLAVTMDGPGEVRLYLAAPALPTDDLWRADLHGDTWRLSAAVPLADVVERADGSAHFPCPALLQVGVTDDGTDVYVDLEAVGVLAIDSPAAAAIVGTLATSLAWSPWLPGGEVLVGPGVAPACAELDRAATASDVWDRVTARQDSVEAALNGPTFAARVGGGEPWLPLVAVVDGTRPSAAPALRPSSGVAAVVVGASSTPFRLRADGGAHVLEPFAIRLQPTIADEAVLDTAAELVAHAGALPLAEVPTSMPATPERPEVGATAPAEWREPRWDVLVSVLGQVTVQDRTGRMVEFEKAKSMELLVWLTQHRERPTRSAARAALWDLAVRDSTFANVVSDCRRSLARLVQPPHGEEWVGRTLTDDLPLHPRVVTDAELLAGRVAAARGLADDAAIAVLRPGVELLHGMPFSGAGSGYLWVDGEGHTSSAVLLATGAAERLALHHLSMGDIDGVFWATGQGLRVLAGHEQLIALRMRAHAMRGDMAGVRLEWEQYERALAADVWSDAEPSPKLAALRRELLGPAVGRPV